MDIFSQLVALLISKNYHISCAESCTGGLFAASLVGVPDASRVLELSLVTYSERMKTEFAAVPAELLEKYGVVSEQVAVAMAKGAAAAGMAEVGVGFTGIAGPGGGTEKIPVGTVCMGFCVNGKTASKTFFRENCGRNELRRLACEDAASMLIKLLEIL